MFKSLGIAKVKQDTVYQITLTMKPLTISYTNGSKWFLGGILILRSAQFFTLEKTYWELVY